MSHDANTAATGKSGFSFGGLLHSPLALPLIGLIVGTLAGFAGGWVDQVLMRITDIFLAFPKLILALAFVAALGPSITNAVLALAITGWPPYARLARAETLTIRNADFIAAARMQGASPLRLLVLHIWPLCLSSLIVRVALDMAGIILSAAGLGFLGLGAQPPTPSWGRMLAEAQTLVTVAPHVAIAPGLAIVPPLNLLPSSEASDPPPARAGEAACCLNCGAIHATASAACPDCGCSRWTRPTDPPDSPGPDVRR